MTANTKKLEKAQELLLAVDESSELPAFETQDLVRHVIHFANTGKAKGLPGARVMELNGEMFYMDTGTVHTDLQKDLAAVLIGELSGPAVGRLVKQARHVTVRSYQMDRGNLVRKERHFVMDLPTLLADVLLSIRSDATLRNDVKQCRLPGCGRFFLKSDLVKDPSAPGRHRDRYCSNEHMETAQTSGGAERTRRWRENMKKQSGARTASKHK